MAARALARFASTLASHTPPPAPPTRVSFLTRLSLVPLIDRLLKRADIVTDSDLRRLVAPAIATGLYVGVGASLLGTMGVDMSPLVAGVSVTGLSAGFAARDVMGNYIAGWTLLLTRPFHPGEYVVLGKAADKIEGVVEKVDMRYVYLRSGPAATMGLVMVPNNVVLNSVLRKQFDTSDDLPHPASLFSVPPPTADLGPSWRKLVQHAQTTNGLAETLVRARHGAQLGGLGLEEQKVLVWLLSDVSSNTSHPAWTEHVASHGMPWWAAGIAPVPSPAVATMVGQRGAGGL